MSDRLHWIDDYLTNKGTFKKSDALGRKAYLLNAVLAIMSVVCVSFVIIDIVLFDMYNAALLNAGAAAAAVFTIIFFKKTNKYKPAAHLSVVILVLTLASFFEITQNKHYAFYWLCILPPIIYFLLEKRAAQIVLGLFGIYMAYFVYANSPSWSPAAFDAQSVFNIIGASFSLVLMIAYYEKSRKEAWSELNKSIQQLTESKEDLDLILNSSAEAIYGVDLAGNCTFCNRSCLTMLGYGDQAELLGKNMHESIHHKKHDGSHMPAEACKILEAVNQGKGTHADDEVFWRADGTSFAVEYFSYPQVKNGDVIGAVITFMDISDRKQKEAEIQYLNCYDTLTGLKNRRCFEQDRAKIDHPKNLPLSVIFADINGLKMINDIFGHSSGDLLLRKSSEILARICRPNDLIARFGGDEFVMLLPNTTEKKAAEMVDSIGSQFARTNIDAVNLSISLGLDTKHRAEQSLEKVMENAENNMYKDKIINRKTVNRDIIDTLIDALHTRNPGEKRHSVSVSALCFDMGSALDLPETEISKLSRAGYLHDIGKTVLDESIVKKEVLSEEEIEIMQQHTVAGYRILNLFDDTLDLAEYIYGHHERWDGSGYPRGLKGEQSPLISRIIAITETYDRVLSRGDAFTRGQRNAALEVIRRGAGTQFDPKLAEVFVRMMENRGNTSGSPEHHAVRHAGIDSSH